MISIVIPCTPKETHYLPLALSSIRKQVGVDFEILLVMNPRFQFDLSSWSDMRVRVLESKIGANNARNTGLKSAQFDTVFFLDADCAFREPKDLRSLYQLLTQCSDLTAVGGRYYLPPNPGDLQVAYNQVQDDWLRSGRRTPTGECLYLLGGCFLIDRSRLKGQIFDSELIYGGTELEFFLRLGQQGHNFRLHPEIGVTHNIQVEPDEFVRKAHLQARGWARIQKSGNFKSIPILNQSAKLSTQQKHWVSEYHRIFQKTYMKTQTAFFARQRQSWARLFSKYAILIELPFRDRDRLKDYKRYETTSKTSESGFNS